MKNTTVNTIRYALQFLLDVNRSIARVTKNSDRLNQARLDIRADKEALVDFNNLVENTEV